MQLLWCKDFLVLAQMRNFSRAADQRCISQSALSRRIKQLEDDLGARLIDRQPGSLQLTPAGRVFLQHCEQMLKQDQALREQISNTIQ